ncbi:MAG: hypothetical protein IBJ16_05990, partial [Chitinophagaceae bacterium]|nr:hypothetical protein [Chitinophagaceae bacterium]
MNNFTRLKGGILLLVLLTAFSAFRSSERYVVNKGFEDKGWFVSPGSNKSVKDATNVRRMSASSFKTVAPKPSFSGKSVMGMGNANISLTVPGNMSFSNTPGTCGRVVTYPAPTAQANPVTVEYDYTGTIQTFTVPAGVTSLTIKGIGADGGNSTSSGVNGGRGASLTGTFAVTPGQVIYMVVGQRGSNDEPDFGLGAAGGGGGTYISASPFGILATPMMVAGGGGGAAAIVDNNIHANANSIDGNYGVTADGGDGALGTGGSGGEAGNNSGAGAGWLTDGLSDINSGDLTGGSSQFGVSAFAGGSLFGVIYGGYGGGGAAGFIGGGGGGRGFGGGGGGGNGGGGGGGSFYWGAQSLKLTCV